MVFDILNSVEDYTSMKLPSYKNKQSIQTVSPDFAKLPEHVAIIMDGNGRWAKKRGLPRIAGHKEGMNTVREITKAAVNLHIKVLTLYAFSTENWKRPTLEVEYLMKLPKIFLNKYLHELMENNVKVSVIGNLKQTPSFTQKAVTHAVEKTKNNTGLLLNFAFNYGGRTEIIEAIKQIVSDINNDQLSIDTLSEHNLSNYLYTNGLSDPDLLIRTSGEQRLSNFLLWQSAYSELWFTDALWPDFNTEFFHQALADYEKRTRRYGGV